MAYELGFRRGISALAVMLAVSGSAFANISRTVSIAHDAKLNRTLVPAGNYEVSWQTRKPGSAVTVTDAKRVVVSTTGRWEARNIAYETNAIVYDTNDDGSRTIVEIRFAGLKGALVFGPSS